MIKVDLRNKRILITAGPTWVPVDSVRIISNTATGETGAILADRLQRLGAKVTLLLGQAEPGKVNKKVRLIRFRFFDELRSLIIKELTSKKYDIVIHSAAVADYKPKRAFSQKISSGKKELRLDLVPTPKIIDLLKKINPSLFVVAFKFEATSAKRVFIRRARELMRRSNLDLVVANAVNGNNYLAYIVNSLSEAYGPMHNKKGMAAQLIKIMGTIS